MLFRSHLHDNKGAEDTHDPVGTGTIRFPDVMNAVRRNGVVPVVEVATFEGTLASITALEKI